MSFVSPAPGGKQTRTDQGVDWSNVKSIVAVAGGKIAAVYGSLPGFGQTIIETLKGGQDVYYAEESAGTQATVTPGQQVAAGQQIAGGGSGGVIEAGYWDPTTGRSAGAPGYTEGKVTAAGTAFRNAISPTKTSLGNMPSYVPKGYRSWVQTAAQDTGIPVPIVAAQINDESGFNANAQSSAGAEGPAQFLPGTFKTYGPKGGSPFNPSDALVAYTNYMNFLLKGQNGNIRNALAAYNAGPGNLQAGYGYADAILAAAGAPRTATAGSPSSYGGTRPGGQSSGSGNGSDTGEGVNKLFADYEAEVTLPRTAPASTFSGGNPFAWWWQSFSGAYAQEQGSGQ